MSPTFYFDIVQGSADWFAARRGIPTASEFATVLAKGQKPGEASKTRRKYMLQLIADRMGADPGEQYTNAAMERGKVMEAEARDAYAFIKGVEPTQVGFVRRGDVGASPDSLIGGNGLLEIKTKVPHLQLETLLGNRLPPEHVAQVQGQLWVCEREFCDFVSYWPKLPPFILRVYRDEAYIAELASGVDAFLSELAALQDRIERAA